MMASSTMDNNGNTFFLLLLIAAVLAVIVYCPHAIQKHGEDADRVRQCMEENGPYQVWIKPDGRVVNVCKIDTNVWGIMVTDGTREITSFIKNKMKSILDVERYLRNMGATLLP